MINTINGVDVLILPIEDSKIQDIGEFTTLNEGVRKTSISSKLKENTKDFLDVVHILASSFGENNRKIENQFCPDEIEVNFNMGFASKLNLWAITANGHSGIGVRLKWRKQS